MSAGRRECWCRARPRLALSHLHTPPQAPALQPSSSDCHAFVGYLEEEAVKTYTKVSIFRKPISFCLPQALRHTLCHMF